MMIQHVKKAAAVAAASLALALPAAAEVTFDAQFLETYYDNGGTDNTVDLSNDQFLFALSQTGPGLYDVSLDGVFITFKAPIVLDYDDFAPGVITSPGVSLIGGSGQDGDGELGLVFSGFGLGGGVAFNVDLDDTNAVVRGTQSVPSQTFFAGSTIEVFYTDNSVERDATFTFGDCDPASPADCSGVTETLGVTDLRQPAPIPSSVALIGLGLLGLAGVRRRRR